MKYQHTKATGSIRDKMTIPSLTLDLLRVRLTPNFCQAKSASRCGVKSIYSWRCLMLLVTTAFMLAFQVMIRILTMQHWHALLVLRVNFIHLKTNNGGVTKTASIINKRFYYGLIVSKDLFLG